MNLVLNLVKDDCIFSIKESQVNQVVSMICVPLKSSYMLPL